MDPVALSTVSSVLSSLIKELQNWRQRQVNFEDSDQILVSGIISHRWIAVTLSQNDILWEAEGLSLKDLSMS